MRTRVIWCATALAALLAGCALTPRVVTPEVPPLTASYGAAQSGELAAGGVLRLAVPPFDGVLSPFSTAAATGAATLWDWYNPVLFSYSVDGRTRQFDPDYVREASAAEDGGRTVVRYRLNPKAVFNDGTPLAAGFVATWKASVQPGFFGEDGYSQIDTVAVDGADVMVTFKRGYPAWTTLFQRLVHPVAQPGDYADTTLVSAHPERGAGPYQLSALASGKAELTRNPRWWGEPAKLDAVTLSALTEAEALDAASRGELDAIDATSRTAAKRVAEFGSAVELRRGSSTGRVVAQLNSSSPLFSDDQVRRGVLTAIDPKELVAFAFTGLDYPGQPLGTLLRFDFQQGYRSNVAAIYTDTGPEAAGRLFDGAGWVKWSDGTRQKDGVPLRVRLAVFGDDPLADGLRTILAQQLRNAGIEVVAERRGAGQRSSMLASGDWDITIRTVPGTPDGATRSCALYCSSGLLPTHDLDERLRAVVGDEASAFEAELSALQQYRALPLWSGPRLVAVKPGLANVGPSGFATPRKPDIGWRR